MCFILFNYLVMEYDAIILVLKITLVVILIIIHRCRHNVFNFHLLIILHLFMMVCYSWSNRIMTKVFFIITIIKLVIISIFHIQPFIFLIPFIWHQLNAISLKQLNVFVLLQFYDAFPFHIHVIIFIILSYKLNKQLVIFFFRFLLTFFYIILLAYVFIF